MICEQLVVCVHYFTAAGEEKGEAEKLQLDHNHRGHSNAISFPMQSHNPKGQTFALIRHLGHASIPFHFIGSINLISVLNEYAEMRNLAKLLLPRGTPSLPPSMIVCPSCLRCRRYTENSTLTC